MVRRLLLCCIAMLATLGTLFGATTQPGLGVFLSKTSESFYGKAVYNDVTRGLFDLLDSQGIAYHVVSTDELLASGVPGFVKLLIIPSNAAVTDGEAQAVEEYLLAGNRVIAGYESMLRNADASLRENYTIGGFLGIQSPAWVRGPYDFMRLSQEGSAFFGFDAPVNIPMPRGFTFTFETVDASVLAFWARDEQGTASTDSPARNAAIVLNDSGLFFGENVFLMLDYDPLMRALFLGAIQKLVELPPASVDVAKVRFVALQAACQRFSTQLGAVFSQISDARRAGIVERWDEIRTRVEQMKEQGSPEIQEVEMLMQKIHQLSYELLPSPVVQTRAMWLDHGAMEATKNPDGLRAMVKRLHELGFNVLLPEVLWRGTSLSNRLGYYPPDPGFAHWNEDPLEVLLDQAHELGMEVHAWTWVFANTYYGVETQVIAEHPEWMERDRFGNVFATDASKTGFFSHSHPQARAFIQGAILDVLDTYPSLDGIHLDYIRYENSDVIDHGYDDWSVAAFRQQTGIDPFSIEKYSPQEVTWHLWRENQVSSMVQQLSEQLKARKPGLLLSAAVVNSPEGAQAKFKQNWELWVRNGWLDLVFPMSYTPSPEDLQIQLDSQARVAQGKTFLIPGLALFGIPDAQTLAREIQLASEMFEGVCLFALAYLEQLPEEMATCGFFRNPAVPAHAPLEQVLARLAEAQEPLLEKWASEGRLSEREKEWATSAWQNILQRTQQGAGLEETWNALSEAKRQVTPNVNDPEISRQLIDSFYRAIEVLRPRWYMQSRVGKKAYTAEKPANMVVVEQPVSIPSVHIPYGDFGEEALGPFVSYDLGKSVQPETFVRVRYDERFLTVQFDVKEPDMDGLQAISGDRDTRVYLGDSVEVFLWPDESKLEYKHFVLSPLPWGAPTVYDEANFDAKWNGYCEANSWQTPEGWRIECQLDLQELGVTPKEGASFRINFNRNRWRSNTATYSGWSCTYGSFHTLERFGYAVLAP
ncbi:MAG TPA: family 10 glycosylhydrolase [Thermotogota bacterium]|nr:family 10 glycosylhydrolase [Thermotogota bacterium]